MYRVIRVVPFWGDKRSPLWQSEKINTVQSPNSVSMLGQRRIRLTGIEPVMGCDIETVLGGWAYIVCTRYIAYAYTDLSAVVVEGIGLHVEDILVSLVLSIIISCTFRILAHKENQYSYVYKILGHFFV